MRTILNYLDKQFHDSHVVTVDKSATSRGATITTRVDQTHLAKVLPARVTYLANIEEAEA